MTTQPTSLSSLPPPKGQVGITLAQLKGLPPPPTGQIGMTLAQAKASPIPQQSLSDSLWSKLGQGIRSVVDVPKNIGTAIGTGIADTYSGNNTEMGNALSTVQPNAGSMAKTATTVTKGLTGDVLAPVTSAFNAITPQPVKNLASGAVEGIKGGVRDFVNGLLPELKKTYDSLPQDWKDTIANSAQTGVNVLGLAGVEKTPMPTPTNIVEGGIKTGAKIADTASNVATKAKATDIITPKMDEGKITDLYNRAIKPTVTGKNTAGQIEKANTQVSSGLKAIADNKANLSFKDANGEFVSGETPKSVDQLTQAIEQTKKSIFQQYDALAKQAGGKGVTVDTIKVGSELTPVIESKSLALTNPKAIKYAKSLQDRLTQTGTLDAQTAQEVIQHYNESLKAFYRNPSYETASNASIDALIANKFRAELDNGISGATGKEYQSLKNQYGALSSMEKDVTHRNIVWGRQNAVGLAGNLANITSGAELVRGLITMNPADIASSLAIKGVQKYMKYLNNPDVGVKKIFSELEKPSPLSKGSTSVLKAEGKVNGSLDTTIPQSQYKSKTFQTGETLKKKVTETPNKQGGFISTGKTADGKYLYHGTNEDVLNNISKEGLKPGMRGQLSLSKTEDYAKLFSKEGITPKGKTSGIVLRVKSDFLEGKTTIKRIDGKPRPTSDQLNEILTKETIPPESLEIYKNGKWQSLVNTPDTSLISQAKKMSKEEFIKKVQNESNISQQGKLQSIPLNKIKGTDYPELDTALSKNKKLTLSNTMDFLTDNEMMSKNSPVVMPIEVIKNSDGTFSLQAGNHRVAQQLINGEKNIFANIVNEKGYSTKSQLSSLWEEANKK